MRAGNAFARPPSEKSRAQAPDKAAPSEQHAVAGVACMQWRALKGSRGCKCKASRFMCLRACQTPQRGADARMRTRVLRGAGNNNGCSGARGTLHAKEYTSARWWGGLGAVRRACCAHRECTRDSRTVAAVGAPAFVQTAPAKQRSRLVGEIREKDRLTRLGHLGLKNQQRP